ncbi:hypothetical protein [Fusibacter bizertensis]
MAVAIDKVIEVTIDQVRDVATFAWRVYQDETKRTTPPYHSFETMRKAFEKKVASKYERLLAYYGKDHLKGVFAIDIVEQDKYIGTTGGPYIESSEAYAEITDAFMTYLERHCKGYVCYFGTTKPNITSQKYLKSKGFICIEDTIQTRIEPSDLKPIQGNFIVQTLSEQDYDLYRKFHQEHFIDYTWTADKIYGVMDKWLVHIVKHGDEIVGNIFAMRQTNTSVEVYGAKVLSQYEGAEMLSQLYYESAKAWFERGVKEIVNFIPEGYMLDAAKRVGFVAYDTYMCYYMKELFCIF